MSKKRTGVLIMELNMRLCRDCAHLTSTLNRTIFRIKPKTMVAAVKPVKTNSHWNTTENIHRVNNDMFSHYLHKFPGRNLNPAVVWHSVRPEWRCCWCCCLVSPAHRPWSATALEKCQSVQKYKQINTDYIFPCVSHTHQKASHQSCMMYATYKRKSRVTIWYLDRVQHNAETFLSTEVKLPILFY